MTDRIDALLDALTARAGSDLLLQSGSLPIIRVDGTLYRLKGSVLTPEDTRQILAELVPAGHLRRVEEDRQLDFAIAWRDGIRLRANAFYQRDTLSIAFRLLPRQIPTFLDLGLPDIVHHFCELPRGLILVTGPTGAGKSTTLAAMTDSINQKRACHIITIEDPIEYVYASGRALVEQREVGRDATSFAAALRTVLDDEKLRAKLCAAGPARARLFSWERTARETLAVYHEAAAHHGRGTRP